MSRAAIGIDVGGTAIKAVLADVSGTVLRSCAAPTSTDRRALIAATREVIDQLHGSAPEAVLGVATAGIPDPDGRATRYCPGTKLDIEGLDWQQALGWPEAVPVLNDAHAALLGECWVGAGRGYRHVVLLTLGTGVGGAVLVDGQLLTGAHGRAGHLGHLSVNEHPARGIVGTPGTLEDAIGEQTVTQRTGGRAATSAALVEAVGRGESWAIDAWRHSVRTLSRAIASIVNAFDPEVVIVGGGIAQAGPALFDPLGEFLASDEWRLDGRGVAVRPAAVGALAGALGAARRALTRHVDA